MRDARKEFMSHVLALIEKQLAMTKVRQQFEIRSGRRTASDCGPCILISRECGSGSSGLARRLGERLGWNVFDSNIVDEIAGTAHVHKRLLEGFDEHIYSVWDQALRDILVDGLSQDEYVRHLGHTIMALGHQGNVVLVGRGSQFFLPEAACLRVRLVAPVEFRAKAVAQREGLSFDRARAKIKEIDARREAFCRKLFHKDVFSPLNQDLMINAGSVGVESAADVVLTAARGKLGVELPPGLAHAA